jgi:hypothetical protein
MQNLIASIRRLGLRPDPKRWTPAEKAAFKRVFTAWFDRWEPDGDCVLDVSPQNVLALAYAEPPRVGIRVRARSTLGSRRPSCTRRRSSSRSSSSSGEPSDSSEPPLGRLPLLAGRDRLIAASLSRIGTGIV